MQEPDDRSSDDELYAWFIHALGEEMGGAAEVASGG